MFYFYSANSYFYLIKLIKNILSKYAKNNTLILLTCHEQFNSYHFNIKYTDK